MNISNHALAGAAIAVAIKQPVLAVPLAFVSHFCLDAVPHFGYAGNGGFVEALKHRLTYLVIGLDVIAWTLLAMYFHGVPRLAIVCAAIAVSPDLASTYRYLRYERRGLTPPPVGRITKLHWDANWKERPWGLVTEIGMFLILLTLLKNLL